MIGHRELTVQDYWQIVCRHRWLILTPAIAGPVLALALTWVLPSRWTSQSVIQIEHQRVPADIVPPVVTEDLNARLATMQTQVLSRTRFEPLIKKYNLFKPYVGRESMEQLVGRLRKAIVLTAIMPEVISRDSNEALPGFSVSVTLDDPRTAQQVCAEITSMFIDENLRQREQAAQGTTNFLQSQLDDAKEALNRQDAKLAAFKEKYFGMLPDETQTNLNVLATLNTQLQAVTNQLNRAQQDKTYNESLLNQITASLRQATAAVPSESHESDLENHLEALQVKLVVMRSRYTSDHPDLVKLRREIADLENQIRTSTTDLPAEPQAKPAVIGPKEPAQVAQLRSQIRTEDQAIRQHTSEENRIQQQIKLYESRLQLSPQVERQYKEITRDHETALGVYNNLLRKRDESQMAANLEREQQGEQFILIDSANLPQMPSFPNRLKFGGSGLVGGIALGCVLAFLLEMRDKALWNELDIQVLLGTYPLARIPILETGKKYAAGDAVVLVPDVSEEQTTAAQG
jgi:protein tyrosine kinase modulator